MTSKHVAIAAQGIGVLALIAVVYFAFLHPGDPGQLAEIDADDGITVQPPPQSVKDNRRDRTKPERRAALGRVAGIVLSQPSLGAPPAPTPDTPTGSQYGDSVAQVLGRLGRGD